VDSIGVGAGTAGYLLKKGYPVVQYRGGEASDDPKRWRNRRVQSYLVLRDGLRDGTVVIEDKFLDGEADWDELEAQLCSIKRKPGAERLEDLETKQDMLRRGIKSPDRPDSMAMVNATRAPKMGGAGVVMDFGELEAARAG